MSGYTPVFNSIFDGTLHGKWPQTGVWLALLAMADRHGCVDRTPQAIASDIGISADELMACIGEFSQPDPMSRTQEQQGRRLVLIEAGRPWGWHIVNHSFYREKARLQGKDAARVSSGVDAQRKRIQRVSPGVPRCPPVSPSHTPDSYSDSDKNKSKSKTRVKTRSSTDSIEFPEGFVLDDVLRQQALSRSSDCDVEQAFEQFKAHHVTRGSTFKNWRSAWVTWIGNFDQFGYPRRKNGAAVPKGMENVKW